MQPSSIKTDSTQSIPEEHAPQVNERAPSSQLIPLQVAALEEAVTNQEREIKRQENEVERLYNQFLQYAPDTDALSVTRLPLA